MTPYQQMCASQPGDRFKITLRGKASKVEHKQTRQYFENLFPNLIFDVVDGGERLIFEKVESDHA